MTELIRNPSTLAKARAELEEMIGSQKGCVNESDIAQLPYLQAVMKEVLRLHPPAPIVDRKIMEDVDIGGFSVPKNTRLMVNLWAIGRNEFGRNQMFLCQRFIESKVDFRGRDFELIPFGAGRRLCLGMPLVVPILHLTLASLLLAFEWNLPDGLEPANIDMKENFGATLTMVVPPFLVPIPIERSLK